MFVLYSSSAGRFSFNDSDNQNSNSNVSSHLSKKIASQTLPLGKKINHFPKGVGSNSEHDFFKSKGNEKIE